MIQETAFLWFPAGVYLLMWLFQKRAMPLVTELTNLLFFTQAIGVQKEFQKKGNELIVKMLLQASVILIALVCLFFSVKEVKLLNFTIPAWIWLILSLLAVSLMNKYKNKLLSSRTPLSEE